MRARTLLGVRAMLDPMGENDLRRERKEERKADR